MNRDEALSLMHEHTQSPSLRQHMLAVEGAMRACARKAREDEESWGLVGLLHDFDYERYPNDAPLSHRGTPQLGSAAAAGAGAAGADVPRHPRSRQLQRRAP